MNSDQICFSALVEVSRRIQSSDLSPVEVTDAILDRIDRIGPSVNCYITIVADRARQQARAYEALFRAGVSLGPLQGVPIALKDDIQTAGVRTTVGSPILKDWIPARSATVAKRLEASGAVLLGKNNMYDFAYNGPNPLYGPTHNPWDLNRTCGGSSSGSAAAVAAGLAFGAIGSDAGGSIRIPASLCGVVGLKPTYGLVSRAGAVPLCPTLAVLGPIGRTVADVAAMLQDVAGFDPNDPASQARPALDYAMNLGDGIRGLRLGILRLESLGPLDPEVGHRVEEAYQVLEREGANLVPISLPEFGLARAMMWAITGSEVAEYLRPYLRERSADFHPVTLASLERTEFIPATLYLRAQRVRKKMIADIKSAMDGVSAVILPTLPITAYPIGTRTQKVGRDEEDVLDLITRFTTIFNLTGLPALTLPCGFSEAGMPIGLQIGGHPWGESTILRIASAYEAATSWHERTPTVSETSSLLN